MARSVARTPQTADRLAIVRSVESEFDLHVSGPHIVDNKIRFHVTDFQTHCGRQLIRIHGGSKVDGHAAEEASGEIRNEGLLGNLVAKIRV